MGDDWDVVDYAVEGEVTQQHLDEVSKSLAPMESRDLAQELSKLELLTKRRKDENAELMVAAYMDRLSRYPADVVRYVLGRWPDRGTFFPSWHELSEDLEYWTRDRLALWNALHRSLGE